MLHNIIFDIKRVCVPWLTLERTIFQHGTPILFILLFLLLLLVQRRSRDKCRLLSTDTSPVALWVVVVVVAVREGKFAAALFRSRRIEHYNTGAHKHILPEFRVR